MSYLFDLAGLANMQKPAGTTQPYDYIGPYITLALAERIEALVEQMEVMNAHQSYLATLEALVAATKDNKPGVVV